MTEQYSVYTIAFHVGDRLLAPGTRIRGFFNPCPAEPRYTLSLQTVFSRTRVNFYFTDNIGVILWIQLIYKC